MLTDVSLREVIAPSQMLSEKMAYSVCKLLSNPEANVVVENGKVYLDAMRFDAAGVVKNGRLIVNFERVMVGVFRLNNVRSLEGCPTRVQGSFDVRSPNLTSLYGGPRFVDTYTAECMQLGSLEHGPLSANHLNITSDKLTSLAGISLSGLMHVNLALCPNVATSDGIAGLECKNLSLPKLLNAITDVPSTAEIIYANPCFNMAKLLLCKGLTAISVHSGPELKVARARTKSAVISAAFNQIINEHDSPRVRFLAAQRALIDLDFDDLV